MDEVLRFAGEALEWLGTNKDVVAVFIAVAVPVYQRRGESKDRRMIEASTNVAQLQAVFFLLNDVRDFLRKPTQLEDFPRERVFDDRQGRDLLRRLHALEQRDLHVASVIALYRARGLLYSARQSVMEWLIQTPLDDTHRRYIGRSADRVGLFVEDIHNRLRAAEFRLQFIRLSWWSPVAKLLAAFRAHRAHDGRLLEEPKESIFLEDESSSGAENSSLNKTLVTKKG
ncbi:hypothetical protein [Achromobacter piechaudii]|uniref:hypothetical protein n=1 Tax=Achromobacter piechaudii TaxID=72556 RepID=UPI003DA9E13F